MKSTSLPVPAPSTPWQEIPGWFTDEEGAALQAAVAQIPAGGAAVELGTWCGRSLACAAAALPYAVELHAFDNFRFPSQAEEEARRAAIESWRLLTADAKKLAKAVVSRLQSAGAKITLHEVESGAGGRSWRGPPVHVLLIDDDHTVRQIGRVLVAWAPHLAGRATVLFHDYEDPRMDAPARAAHYLAPLGFRFNRTVGGMGTWVRGDLAAPGESP